MMTMLLVAMLQVAPQAPPQTPPAQTSTTDYKVGPQDKLNITVLGIPEFSSTNVIVDNDGLYSYLDLGRLPAAGKTVREIQKDIRDLLIKKGLHRNPTVTVDVAEFRSQMVYVSGAVSRPAGYRITGNETLLSILAQAGFTAAAGQTIEVTRNKPTQMKFTFDRRQLESGNAPSFQLQDGDAILVPEAEKCYVRGEVHSPGSYEVATRMTVDQLIIAAGDFNERAAKGAVYITRKATGAGRPTTFKVKSSDFATTLVQPGDIVDVKRRIL
jgi:polysaccharide biosynthesis/export protein